MLNSNFNTNQNMLFGQLGLKLCQPLSINSNNIFSLKLFLNKSSSSGEETSRNVWLSAFPHWPLTNNHIGSRMGNGTGKLNTWFSKLSTGHILIELNNLRFGRSIFFLKQVQHSLNCYSKIITTTTNTVTNVTSNLSNNNIPYQSYW